MASAKKPAKGAEAPVVKSPKGKAAGTRVPAEPKAAEASVPHIHPTIEIDWSTEPDPSYANVALVLPSYEAIGLVFAEVMPPVSTRSRADGSPYESANIVASVRLAPSAMPSFIDAAIEAWHRHLDAMAAITPPVYPRFQRISAPIVPAKGDGK